MAFALMISAITKAGFFRCGTSFPHEGRLVVEGEFSETQMEVLANEPNLRMRPATEEEIAAATEDAADVIDIVEQISGVIPTLEDAAFNDKGVPDVKAIRKALPDIEAKAIGAAERDAALKILTEGGFTAPTKQPPE